MGTESAWCGGGGNIRGWKGSNFCRANDNDDNDDDDDDGTDGKGRMPPGGLMPVEAHHACSSSHVQSRLSTPTPVRKDTNGTTEWSGCG